MSDKETSYRNTALLGVSSVFNILLSIVRNKVFSLYLAPAGIGQFGILNDFIGSVHSIGSLGVADSGVQAVSKASTDSGEMVRKIYNALHLRLLLSIALVVAVVVLARPISFALTGDESCTIYLRIASIALLLKFRSTLQSLLITGMKRVGLLRQAR